MATVSQPATPKAVSKTRRAKDGWLHMRIPDPLRRELKALAGKEDRWARELVIDAVERYIATAKAEGKAA